MNTFSAFVQVGFEHIADLRGYDHMLFVITLCAVYTPSEWKKVLILVTAFTVGHSVTLVMSALNVFRLPSDLVETLIPITILLTALHNVAWHRKTGSVFGPPDRLHYLLALCFGFIHGMGFSNYFRALLGAQEDILLPLFAFNVGLEAGQVMIVLAFFAVYALAERFIVVKARDWTLFISGAGAGVSLVMLLENLL